jgi:hypothetical protein
MMKKMMLMEESNPHLHQMIKLLMMMCPLQWGGL